MPRANSTKTSSVAAVAALCLIAPPRSHAQTSEPGQFSVGIEERVRSDDWNNMTDMSDKTNDQRDQVRDRTRLWMNVPLPGQIDFFVGAATESIQKFGAPKTFGEVYFDQAYLNFRKLFVPGLALKIGRQEMMKGEGFLIMDGSPGDGPRSLFLNAVDLSYTRGKSRLEAIGILDPARDRLMPVWHAQPQVLQTWDEQAIGAYFTNTDLPNTSVETYYFLKKEIHDSRAVSNPQFQPDRHVNTSGARVVVKLTPRTNWATEYARQLGAAHNGSRISAFGGYSYVKHTFDRRLEPWIKGGYWALSGTDPKKPHVIGNWDPLFSQWPEWSDGYVYTLNRENGISYWTNLRMCQAEAGFAPVKKTTLALVWYHMNSFYPFTGTPKMFGQGIARGEDYQLRFEYNPSPNWKAYIHYEPFHPSDFYAANRAPAYEVQAFAQYRFTWHPLGKAGQP